MFGSDDIIRKEIVTSCGEDTFQVRYSRDEDVGLLTTASGKSYWMLDSKDYWYDVIQERYPSKIKCSCKNEWFRVRFHFIPGKEAEEYRAVEIVLGCTECGKPKQLATVHLSYAPANHLLRTPISYCENPKIKYKTYQIGDFWSEDSFERLIDFLSKKQLRIYGWIFRENQNQREFCNFTTAELKDFLKSGRRYIAVYFTATPFEEMQNVVHSEGDDDSIEPDAWRKECLFQINAPIAIGIDDTRYWYSMQFCSEYIESEKIVSKNETFVQLVSEVLRYCKANHLG